MVSDGTLVMGLEEGRPCRLTCENGTTVAAGEVVVATHYPIFDRALLFSRLRPRRELVVAAPLPPERDPGGMYVTTEHNTRSIRTTPHQDGQRLLIVTGEIAEPGSGDAGDRFRRLAAWTTEHFAGSRISHRWAAQDNATTDHLPYVGRLHRGADHVYVATGFSGWGMSNGVAFNQAEQTWECPCHGSRFATDGGVLHGPATRPLEPVDPDNP